MDFFCFINAEMSLLMCICQRFVHYSHNLQIFKPNGITNLHGFSLTPLLLVSNTQFKVFFEDQGNRVTWDIWNFSHQTVIYLCYSQQASRIKISNCIQSVYKSHSTVSCTAT